MADHVCTLTRPTVIRIAEQSLELCAGTSWVTPSTCSGWQVAAVSCDPPPIRVLNTTTGLVVSSQQTSTVTSSGELQIQIGGSWEPFCNSTFNESAASAMCAELGMEVSNATSSMMPSQCVNWQTCMNGESACSYQVRRGRDGFAILSFSGVLDTDGICGYSERVYAPFASTIQCISSPEGAVFVLYCS